MRAPVLALLLVTTALAGCFHADEKGEPQYAEGCPKVEGRSTLGPLWSIETAGGQIVVEMCAAMAPRTVNHFLNLTRSGVYKDASFYRIAGPSATDPDGFVIQGGVQQPGASVPRVADEFHPLLRHDRAGVLSLAHGGPGTGSSEFFITLSATPHLDDRHSVFGYVVGGMDVVREISRVPVQPSSTGENSKPVAPVKITRIGWKSDPSPPPLHAQLASSTPLPSNRGAANENALWGVVVRNLGNYNDNVTATLEAPEGWATSVDQGLPTQTVPAGRGAVFIVSTLPPAGTADGTYNLTFKAASGNNASATTSVPLTLVVGELGGAVQSGWRVEVNYLGMVTDGRIFDTSYEQVAKDEAFPKFATQGGFQYRGAGRYGPFNFTVGSNEVIPGFSTLAQGGRIGETVVGRLPSSQAYATGNVYQSPLVGKPLVFWMELVQKCDTTTRTEPC